MVETGRSPSDLPLTDSSQDAGKPRPAIRYYPDETNPNAVDLIRETTSSSFLYEPTCFDVLTNRYPDFFILGPCLLDYAFAHSEIFRPHKKPDAILFVRSDGHLVLRRLFEFKSKNTNGIQKKLEGFSDFLDNIREHPGEFSALFTSECDGIVFPEVIVPPKSEIKVIFVTPHPNRHSGFDTRGFRVGHLVVPKQTPRQAA